VNLEPHILKFEKKRDSGEQGDPQAYSIESLKGMPKTLRRSWVQLEKLNLNTSPEVFLQLEEEGKEEDAPDQTNEVDLEAADIESVLSQKTEESSKEQAFYS